MGLLSFGKKPVEQILKEGAKNEQELKQLITEACERGAVHAKFFIDSHGPEKKPTEDALIQLVGQLTKEKGVLHCKSEIETSVESEKLYSAFASVDLVTGSFNNLINLALKYAPASVEILEPNSKIVVPIKQAQDILLDASQSTQQYSKYILESIMTLEQKQDFVERLKRKAEFGAKMRESAQTKQ